MNEMIGRKVLGREPEPGENVIILDEYANTSLGRLDHRLPHSANDDFAAGDTGLICSLRRGLFGRDGVRPEAVDLIRGTCACACPQLQAWRMTDGDTRKRMPSPGPSYFGCAAFQLTWRCGCVAQYGRVVVEQDPPSSRPGVARAALDGLDQGLGQAVRLVEMLQAVVGRRRFRRCGSGVGQGVPSSDSTARITAQHRPVAGQGHAPDRVGPSGGDRREQAVDQEEGDRPSQQAHRPRRSTGREWWWA